MKRDSVILLLLSTRLFPAPQRFSQRFGPLRPARAQAPTQLLLLIPSHKIRRRDSRRHDFFQSTHSGSGPAGPAVGRAAVRHEHAARGAPAKNAPSPAASRPPPAPPPPPPPPLLRPLAAAAVGGLYQMGMNWAMRAFWSWLMHSAIHTMLRTCPIIYIYIYELAPPRTKHEQATKEKTHPGVPG